MRHVFPGGGRMRQVVTACAVAALVAVLAGTASAAKAPPKKVAPPLKINPIFTYNKADREQHLYACAKTEGKVVFYTSTSLTDTSLKPAFEKAYPGVQLQTYVNTSQLPTHLLQEENAGIHNFDVYGDVMGNIDRTSKYFQPFWTPAMANVRSELQSPYMVGYSGYVEGLVYNPNLIAPADVPKKWTDLLLPKYAGKLYMGTDTTAPVFTALLRRIYGQAFYQKLAKVLHIEQLPGSGIADQVVAGTAPIGIDVSTTWYKNDYLNKGAPLRFAPIDPMVAFYQAASISKNTDHPCASMLFVDWLLANDGGVPLFSQYGTALPFKNSGILPFKMDGVRPYSTWKIYYQTTPDFIKGFANYTQALGAWNDMFRKNYLGG
jgi:iron(III) transport system substrate-binding protein